ncbi:hypothetical protein F2Q70_00003242 [Brassica cretica]|uniref:Uncharacterized protein n=1 Tax=Brassica cretica TaxID=69181 RepID=A0A8S9J4S3_BRACR|nr:hypothetical protein F2Q70_00003242 [Brassica cretica]
MSGMNNPTLHRHAVHGLQGATPSLCLHDLFPFTGPSHEVNDHKISLVQAIIVYLGSYQLSPCLVLLILNQISSVQTRFIQYRISSVQLRSARFRQGLFSTGSVQFSLGLDSSHQLASGTKLEDERKSSKCSERGKQLERGFTQDKARLSGDSWPAASALSAQAAVLSLT